MDDYLDSFLILALDARYTDPWTLVVKFYCRLKLNVQSQIATMPFGRPADTDLEAWYAAVWRIDQAWLANEAFQSTLQLTTVTPVHSTLLDQPLSLYSALLQQLCLPFRQDSLRLHLYHLEEYSYITNGHLLFVMGALILQRVQKCKVR